MDTNFFLALAEVMMVNIVLSGDNAVVIALAARRLPPPQQRLAILFGSGGAALLRVLLTIVAVEALRFPFLRLVGALLLVWIAVRLLVEEKGGDKSQHADDDLFGAVKMVLIADVVMSLDNTLAIAGLARGDWAVLVLGLALSVPLIVYGSALIVKMIDRYPVILYVGAGLIAYTAGEMIDSDVAVQPYLPYIFDASPGLGILLASAVIAYGHCCNARRSRARGPAGDRRAAQGREDEID